MTAPTLRLRHRLRRYCSVMLWLAIPLFACSLISQAQTPEVAATNRPAGEWTRYRVKDGEFSLLLPAAPAVKIYKGGVRIGGSPNRLHELIGAYYQGCGYVISVYELKESLDDFIKEFQRRFKGEFLRDFKVAGMSGKEYGFSDATGKGITRFLDSKKRTYVFMAEASILGKPDVDFPRFFESISFARPVEGNVLVDGPSDAQTGFSPPPAASGDDTPVYKGRDVNQRVRVLSKPEPKYTEAGRREEIMGTVVLRCVFSAAGEVEKFQVISGLPHGLTEQAIAAARHIKFIPGIKDGKFVSMHLQLEYNFSLY